MANSVVTFMGAIDGAHATMDAERALYLKMFAGEVLTAFPEFTHFLDKHVVKQAINGKTAQFPLIGRMPPAEYHIPGTEILGQEVPLAEKTISVERLLISHLFTDNLDQKIAHFDSRSEISRNMALRLAQTYDNNVARNLVKAAKSVSPIAADTTMGGTVITDADLISAVIQTRMDAWVDALFLCRTTFDNKFVNDGTVWCALKPEDYYFIIRNAMASGYSLLDSRIGGNGSISKGTMQELAGTQLVSTPQLPTTDYSAEAFNAVDCRLTNAIVWTRGAAGTVKVFDIGIETEYQVGRQGTLVVAKQAYGHDVLQGECAIQMRSAAPGA